MLPYPRTNNRKVPIPLSIQVFEKNVVKVEKIFPSLCHGLGAA
jgi:hypothetical protein